MRVRDIDSNGLIHLLNQEAAEEENDDVYHKAVLNILNAQKFSCIPLVDNTRIRDNTNNLVDRAVYESGQGVVTHIARKRIYDDESELVIVDVNNIPLVNDDDDVMIGIEKFFSRENDVDRCHFCLLVGKSKEEPTALLTIYELKSNSIRDEILKRMAIASVDQENVDTELLRIGVQIQKELGEISEENDYDVEKMQTSVDSISNSISKVPIEENPQETIRRTNLYINDFSDLRVKDVMTVVCAGIYWNEEPSSQLAAKILSQGNDFDNLIIFDENNATRFRYISIEKNVETNQIKKIKEPTTAKIASTESQIMDIYIQFKNNSINNFLVIPPNNNLIFGEGGMKWPGVITDENLQTRTSLLHVGTMCVDIEYFLRKTVENMGIEKISGRDGISKEVSKCTMGQIVHELRWKDLFRKMPIEKNDLYDVIELRNHIFHTALSTEINDDERKINFSYVCSANRVLLALKNWL